LIVPANPTDSPDLYFYGTYAAAGGSNPLYQFEVKGGYFFPVSDSWVIKPAINTQIEISQNARPPVHPAFEFNRSEPSGNIIASFIVAADFRPWQPKPKFDSNTGKNDYSNIYATVYPFIGMEAGQFGTLPPFFELVDHEFTFGIKLQAVQGTKPANSKLVQ
jgi:hypothetical protein